MNHRFLLLLLVVVILAVLIEITETTASSSRRKTSERRRKTSTRRRRRATSNTGGNTAVRMPVTKFTPIKASSRYSPVIHSQTRVRNRALIGGTALVGGYLAYRYTLGRAPIYRGRYPMDYSNVDVYIPPERAFRLNYTEEVLLDSNGERCVNSNESVNLLADLSGLHKSDVNTSVTYEDQRGLKRVVKFSGENASVNIDFDAVDTRSIELKNMVSYDSPVANNTNCTQIMKTMNGTFIEMYQYNPEAGSGNVIINSAVLVWVLMGLVAMVLRN